MPGLISFNGGVFHILKKDGNPTCKQRPKQGAVLCERPIEDFDLVSICYSCLHQPSTKPYYVPASHQPPPEVFKHRKDFYDKD